MKRNASVAAVLRYLARILALAVGYLALAKLGLTISPVNGFATLVWAPAGVAVAALVLGGYRLWPGIAAGALIVNLWLRAPPPVAFLIAVGEVLEATLGAMALRAVLGPRRSFERCVDVLALAVPAALLSTAVGAAVGTASLALGGLIRNGSAAETWQVWWMGDFAGVVVVTPLVLTWARPSRGIAPARKLPELVGVGALLLLSVAFVFTRRPDALARLHVGTAVLLPGLVWAAFRFEARGAATATALVAVAGVWGTVTGHGNYANTRTLDGLLRLLVALAVLALVALALGTAVSERERSVEAQRASDARLRAIMEGTTDAVVVKDRVGRFLFVNGAGASVLGSTPEAVLGQGAAAFLGAEQARRLREMDEDVMREGHPRTEEVSLALRGERRVFLGVTVPYLDGAGGVLGVIVIARDITEQKLAELNRARLAAIVDSSSDAISSRATDGTITTWNAAAQRLFGYAPEEAIGQPVSMLVPPDQREQLAEMLAMVERGEEVKNQETVRCAKGGRRIDVAVTLSPLHDAAGRSIGTSAITREVTGCAERWRLASEAAHLGMWCWTPENDRLGWTPLCREMHGVGPDEEGVYARFVAALHPDNRQEVELAIQRCLEDHSDYRVTYRVQWPDGSVHWISVLGRSHHDDQGNAERMVGVALDVTAQKQAEAERAALLAREQAARADAESAGRAKDDFLAVVSHELRTPLQSMLGWAQLLKGRVDDPATLQKGLDTIERNARTQAQLIEDLLDVSRIVAGTLRLERRRVDVGEILRAALESGQVLADARSIRIEAANEPLGGEVLGDPQRLQQIFTNLLSNAVKFTASPGRVGVRLRRVGARAEIAFEDSGCGISHEFLPHVFERFRQAEDGATTRRRGGLGLGLAIVRHLVEAHGGSVQAESPGVGRGATFTVALPLVPAPRRAVALARAEASRCSATRLVGVRVLVVDDDPDACDLLETVLRSEGAEVRAVQSAGAALDALATYHPDVLLSDIGMPEEDGYALIGQLRARERRAGGGHVPALALTAFASAADRAQALALGFEAHLAKPASPRDLAGTVASLVGRTA